MYNPQMAPFQPENIDRTTAMLVALKEKGQLAQYMQQHKSDPYMMSLASSVNAMAEAAKPLAAPNQPTVVDQELAQMDAQQPMPQGQAQGMPEDSGIAQLPTPNMETMAAAEGGIVGYADGGMVAFGSGGEVPRFQTGGVPRVGSHGLASIIPDKTGYEGMGIMEFLQAFGSDMLSKLPTEDKVRLQQNQAKKEAAGATEMQAYRPRPTMEQGQADVLYEQKGLMPRAPALDAPVAAPGALPVAAPGAAPVAPGAGPVAPGALPVAGGPRASVAPRAPAAPEIGFADRLKAAMGETPDFAAQRAANIATEKAGAEAGLEKLKTSLAAESEGMFKGREERVGKREAALEKSKDANTGMAFLEAGLAMMQSRGRGLAGIAEGAAVGTKQYASGIKDIRAAQEKLDDARDRMEELRQNQASMNNREIRAAEKGILDIVNRGNEKQLDGAEKMYGIKREDMRTAVASDLTVSQAEKTRAFEAEQGGLDRASREKIANMQPAEIQKISLLGGGDFAKGYEIYKQEAAIPRLYESYTKMASDPLRGADFQAKFPTFEVYRAGMGGGGKILDIPDAAAGAVRPR